VEKMGYRGRIGSDRIDLDRYLSPDRRCRGGGTGRIPTYPNEELGPGGKTIRNPGSEGDNILSALDRGWSESRASPFRMERYFGTRSQKSYGDVYENEPTGIDRTVQRNQTSVRLDDQRSGTPHINRETLRFGLEVGRFDFG